MSATKFRLMETENKSSRDFCQQEILSNVGDIQSRERGSLDQPMRRKLPVKDVLARKMREAGGITPPELSRRAAEKGYQVSPTAIKEILRGATQNPGYLTLEAIALGLNLSPVHFIADMLGSGTDDPNFKAGKLAVAHELYKGMTNGQRVKAEPLMDGLIWQLQHIKNQM